MPTVCHTLGQGIEVDDVTISGPLNLDSRRQRMRLRNKEIGALLGADPREVQRKEEGWSCLGWSCLGWWMAVRLPGCVGTGGTRWRQERAPGRGSSAPIEPERSTLGMRSHRGHT